MLFLQQFYFLYITMDNQSHEIAKQIRQEFFVYRNGLLADTLRNAGDTHKMIFGLNLSQITDIAKRFDANELVANELWNSNATRECRLIAPMLYPINKFDEETAYKWISEVENTEIADNLCHKLLRNTPFASKLCLKFANGSNLERYTALILAINLITIGKALDKEAMQRFAQTEIESNNPTTLLVAKRLIEDLLEY